MIDAKIDWKTVNKLGKTDWMKVIVGEDIQPKFKGRMFAPRSPFFPI